MCLLSDFSFVVLRYASELWWPSNIVALIMIVEVVMLGITVSKVRINGKALDYVQKVIILVMSSPGFNELYKNVNENVC